MIKYSTISIQVPEGYEKQVTDLVLKKIEGILSTLLLSPTEEKKNEFNSEMSKVCVENNIQDTFISKIITVEK